MSTHLNFDSKQNNGVIMNDLYPNGAMYQGIELKPTLSFEYDDFICSAISNVYTSVLAGESRYLTEDEKIEIAIVIASWVQELGQEGNPNAIQIIEQTNATNRAYLLSTDWYVARAFEDSNSPIPVDIGDARAAARLAIV